ncbi:response regulator transcription factor [Burkholderia ambifaria]|uniref:Two component transcriptional regulator, LuxR family n=1 Tax=Burkholderia ambifaria MEX-5 TaxID=396597 RepID=B1T3D5_9BURK|nr:response regulator transcription factor [Burkholderia ambifaria]EDT41905.1 two component transcriptional regulator, LuxR family [Burkholderia ambifaria MEX-5]
MNSIRVGVADDHPVVLAGIENLIKNAPGLEIAFLADTMAAMIEAIESQPIDVLVCDYEFSDEPLTDGLNLLASIRRRFPALKVLLTSTRTAPGIVSAALIYGATGFIGKVQANPSTLTRAILAVHAGSIYLSPEFDGNVLSCFLRVIRAFNAVPVALSDLELQVVGLICRDVAMPEIARRLNRSPGTIAGRKRAAMKKLAAGSDAELKSIARDMGIFR